MLMSALVCMCATCMRVTGGVQRGLCTNAHMHSIARGTHPRHRCRRRRRLCLLELPTHLWRLEPPIRLLEPPIRLLEPPTHLQLLEPPIRQLELALLELAKTSMPSM